LDERGGGGAEDRDVLEAVWNRPATDGRRRGISLIEVMITVGILSVVLTGLVAALLSSMRLRQLNAEKATARNAAEQALSAMRGMGSIREAYIRFGGGGPEGTFEVFGLAAPAAGEAVGRVIVWRNKSGNPPDPGSTLALSAADAQEARSRFGMPFPLALIGTEGPFGTDFLDTNGDGGVSAADNPSLMPVTVRIRWRSRSGVITEYFSTVLGLR
jgi:prepilin-type N-terminal cleavage/methylation domain-containing protein